MATSGTRTFTLDFAQVADLAIAMAGGEPTDAALHKHLRYCANLVLIDWQARGTNLWELEETTLALSAGVATYTLAADVLDLTDALYRNSDGVDMTLGRISRSEYAMLSDKDQSGRPSTFVVLRDREAPLLRLWPVPDSSHDDTLYYWYIRRNEDLTSHAENVAIPDRFLPAFVHFMAYEISKLRPGVDPAKQQLLKQEAETLFGRAQREDRERVPTTFRPDLSAYRYT